VFEVFELLPRQYTRQRCCGGATRITRLDRQLREADVSPNREGLDKKKVFIVFHGILRREE